MRDAKSSAPPPAEHLGRGDFVRLAYRLGASRATGILTVFLGDGNAEIMVLRRGELVTRGADPGGRKSRQRLERAAAAAALAHFDGGVSAYPPASRRTICLAGWARTHLEAQVDQRLAEAIVRELAGVRLVALADRVPDPRLLDDTDQRILTAMREPRRLDQIWPMARAPRFRLLTFLHFLRAIGAVHERGVVATAADCDPRDAALAALGVGAGDDRATVKRAYRRLARALHPDLQPAASPVRRRNLERKLAEINEAYRTLLTDEAP